MKCNIGKTDKVIRIVAGVALIAAGVMTQSYLLAAVGLVPLLTAIVNFCPLYSVLGINTGCSLPQH